MFRKKSRLPERFQRMRREELVSHILATAQAIPEAEGEGDTNWEKGAAFNILCVIAEERSSEFVEAVAYAKFYADNPDPQGSTEEFDYTAILSLLSYIRGAVA